MALIAANIEAIHGLVLYAKPLPLVSSPWASDVVYATEDGSTGNYAFLINSTLEYSVYQRIGGSPASTDPDVGQITPNAPVPINNAAANEIRAEIAQIDDILSSGVNSVTVDGTTTVYNHDSLRMRRRNLQEQLNKLSARENMRRPVASSVWLGGF